MEYRASFKVLVRRKYTSPQPGIKPYSSLIQPMRITINPEFL
jgi:hypothetical protein